jgi:hypothetical protein
MMEDFTLSDLKLIIKEAIKESFEEIDEIKHKLAYQDAQARMRAHLDINNEIIKSVFPKTALGNHDFPINQESTLYKATK